MKKTVLIYLSILATIMLCAMPVAAENSCPDQISEWANSISAVLGKIQNDNCSAPVNLACHPLDNNLYQIASINFADTCLAWKKAGLHQLNLYLQTSESINAIAKIDHDENLSVGLITLSSSLMQTIKNDDQLAFVLAHEIAHLKKNYVREDLPILVLTPSQEEHMIATHRNWELEADMQAFLTITKAGYSHREALNLLGTLSVYENTGVAANHPSIKERMLSLNKQASLPN